MEAIRSFSGATLNQGECIRFENARLVLETHMENIISSEVFSEEEVNHLRIFSQNKIPTE